MTKRQIKITGMRKAEEFNRICSSFPFDIDLEKGKYYINAKSIMGIFSMDLDETLTLVADTDDAAAIDKAFQEFFAE